MILSYLLTQKQLHEACKGTKQLILFEGEHNSLRPPTFVLKAVDFLKLYTAGLNEVLSEELQKEDCTTVKMESKKTPLKLAELKFDEKKLMKSRPKQQDDFKRRFLTQHRTSLNTTRSVDRVERTDRIERIDRIERVEKELPQVTKPRFQFSWLEHNNSAPSLPLVQTNSPRLDDQKKKITPKHSNNSPLLLNLQRDIVADENSPLRPNQSAEVKMSPHRISINGNTGPRPREFTGNIVVTSESNTPRNLIFSPKNQSDFAEGLNKVNQITGQAAAKKNNGLSILIIDLNTTQNTEVVKDLSLLEEDELFKTQQLEKVADTPQKVSSYNRHSCHSQPTSAGYVSRASYPRSSAHNYTTYSPTYQMSKFSQTSHGSQHSDTDSDASSVDSHNNFNSTTYRATSYQNCNQMNSQASSSPYAKRAYTINESTFARASVHKNNQSVEIFETPKHSEEEATQPNKNVVNRETLSFNSRVAEVSSAKYQYLPTSKYGYSPVSKYEYSPVSKYGDYYTPRSATYTNSQPKNEQSPRLEKTVSPYKLSEYSEKLIESRNSQNKSVSIYPNNASETGGSDLQQPCPTEEEKNCK